MTKRFTHLEYTKLLIATGASPRVIPIRGGEKARNIRYLRTPDDANAIYQEAKGQDILIVGSGFIGCGMRLISISYFNEYLDLS